MCLAVPGKIISIEEDDDPFKRMAKVSFGGVARNVSLAYVPDAKVDDYVIVHVGMALNIVDSKEAEQVFKDLEEIERLGNLSGQS